MAILFYMRVSTTGQDTYRQEEEAKTHGYDMLYRDKQSGKDMDRPGFREMMNYARTKDTIVVSSIDRLGRTVVGFVNFISELKEKGIYFKSIKEPWAYIGEEENSIGEVFAIMMSFLAQMERKTILDRQRAGIKKAKNEGKYKGRKKIEVDEKQFKKVYKMWKDKKITGVQAQKMLGLKKVTFYARVKEFEKIKLVKVG